MTHWTLEPLQLAPIAVIAALYAKRVRTLRVRGQAPPAWRIGLYALGVALLFLAVASPVDFYGEESSQAMHMSQHILLADLAPLALLAGLTGPVLRPLLALIHPLRRLFHPFVALTIWAIDLALWHIPFVYEAALHHDSMHALEHVCFFAGGTLVWVPVLETLPMPEWFGTGLKMGFIAAVRVFETVLGNIFIWANGAFYATYVGASRPWGISAVDDQRLAGSIMMVEGSLVTIAALCWLFLKLAAEGELRQELLERGLDPRAVRRAVRYGRAQELDAPR